MCRVEETKKAMIQAGWTLASQETPGVYVRSAETIRNDQFNWKKLPSELLDFIDRSRANESDNGQGSGAS